MQPPRSPAGRRGDETPGSHRRMRPGHRPRSGIAARLTWLIRRRSLDSGRGHAGRTSGQMARGPGGMGDPRAHQGRRAGLALGAAAAGVRTPHGPADGRTGGTVLRAGGRSARAGRHRPGHRLGCRGRVPATGPARDHDHRRGHRCGHAHPARRACGRGRPGRTDGIRRLAGRRGSSRAGGRGDLSPRGLQRPRYLEFPRGPDKPCPQTGSS